MHILFALLLFVVPRADTVYVLPDVTVTATRLERSAFEATARIDVIDAAAARRAGARTLADALQLRSGAFVRRYGAGGLASLSLRGSGASQTTILLDGRRLTDPQLGQLDLSLLPAAILDRVEIMNGAASPFFGSDGIGGAVSMRTVQPTGATSAAIEAGIGAFGSREASLQVGGGSGPWALLLVADAERATNAYGYFSRALQRDVRLEGADRSRTAVFGTATYATSGADLRLSVLATDAERGLAGSAGTSRGERQWDQSTRVWGVATIGRRRHVRVGGLVQRSTMTYVNPLLALDQTGRSTVVSVDAEVERDLAGTWSGLAGAEAALATAEHPHLTSDPREQRGALYLQTTGEAAGVMITPAARLDIYREAGGGDHGIRYASINPRLGMSLPLRENLRARTSVGRGFRAPTFNDRYWSPGGNPALRPERGWTYDAGIVLRAAASKFDLTSFLVETRDQIVWLPRTGAIWTPRNLTHTRSMGLEAGAEHRRRLGGVDARVGGRYTLTHARDRSDPASPAYGKPLRYVPRDLLRVHASIASGPLEAELNVHHTGRRFINEDASDPLPAVTTASLRLGVTTTLASGRLRTGVILENLFDADYALVAGQPMPPRHARFSISLQSSSD